MTPSSPAKLAFVNQDRRRHPIEQRDVYSLHEAARLLGIAPKSLRNWASVPFFRVNQRGDRRYLRTTIEAIRGQWQKTDPEPPLTYTEWQAYVAWQQSNPDGTLEDALARSSDLVRDLAIENQHLRGVMALWRDYWLAREGTAREPNKDDAAISLMVRQFDAISPRPKTDVVVDATNPDGR